MARTIVGVFEESSSAQTVLSELQGLGLGREQARVMSNSDASSGTSSYDGSSTFQDSSNSSSTFQNASAGTSQSEVPWTQKVKSWFGSMFDDDEDRSHADNYAEAWRRGHYLVVADVENELVDQVVAVMNRNGAVDIQRRSEQWRETGYTGSYDESASPYTTDQYEQERATYGDRSTAAETEALPVVQEELAVGKRVVQRGGVRIHSYVQERPVEEIVRLREEHVSVQRRPVDRRADASDLAFKDRTVEVTATGEEAVVAKEARVVEEVIVSKDVSERDQKIEETLRRKDVQVENIPAGNPNPHR